MLKTYIENNLKNSFIRLSKSPARATILFIKKINDSLWLYINYQRFNNLTIKNHYLLSLIGKSFNCPGQVKYFMQLNLTIIYYWMRIREGDKWITAFQTRYGYFKYQVISFGLSNALASFQGYVNKVLSKKLDIFMIIYLNNILIYIKGSG